MRQTTLRQLVVDHVTDVLALHYRELALIRLEDFSETIGALRLDGTLFNDDTPRVEALGPYTVEVLKLWLEVRGREPGPLFVLPPD